MSLGMMKSREAPMREIRSTVIARDRGAHGGATSVTNATITAFVTGGHALLRFGIYVSFMPESGQPDLTAFGYTFSIFGWIADANGKLSRASGFPINGTGTPPTTGTTAPDGWEGCSSLAQYEVQSAIGFTNVLGEWRVIVVAEPAEAGMDCDLFEQLVGRIDVRLEGQEPTIVAAAA